VSLLAPSLDAPGQESPSDHLAIEVVGLTKRFGASRALASVSVEIPWSQRVAILGPNGAGKTSLLRILSTLARPTSGNVVIGGLRLPDDAAAARRYLGFVAHQTFLYDDLTVRENLRFYGRLYRISAIERRIEHVLRTLGILDRADDRVRVLSRGLQQRAALARAILHDPPILLLDEPETGLDVAGSDVLDYLLLDAAGQRRTVLLTSHDVSRAIRLVDRVLVIVRGKIVLDRSALATSTSDLEAIIRGESVSP
jgi:heme exporter protein A